MQTTYKGIMASTKILFRGKTVVSEGVTSWVEGNFVDPCNIVYEREGYDTALKKKAPIIEDVRVIPETVGQFIRIWDSKGMRIYEGDIVEHNGDVGVIEWHTQRCGFVWRSHGVNVSISSLRLCYLNVIGNIYDNPELLKEEDGV